MVFEAKALMTPPNTLLKNWNQGLLAHGQVKKGFTQNVNARWGKNSCSPRGMEVVAAKPVRRFCIVSQESKTNLFGQANSEEDEFLFLLMMLSFVKARVRSLPKTLNVHFKIKIFQLLIHFLASLGLD